MGDLKYVFVTGGVISGLGKGVVTASIGKIIQKNNKIVPIKCDGYLNVDPGTMNPFEHGEVFVLDDGAEVDLDFGHYERFLNVDCKNTHSITSGKIFQRLVEKERKGEFLGKTVQVIPHVTQEIRSVWKSIADEEKADILLIEIGGTVGDIENLWFLEAAREVLLNHGKDNVLFVHLGYVPEVGESLQQKTKPLQQSLNILRERGIFPDVIVGRSSRKLDEKTKSKIHWLCNIDSDAILSDPNLEYVYELPLLFEEEGITKFLKERLALNEINDLSKWKSYVNSLKNPSNEIIITICGKYTEIADSYISIQEALIHAGAHTATKVKVRWVETTELNEYDSEKIKKLLGNSNGVIVPGGFGQRGTEGKINVIRYCRENKIPFLGICYGMQLAVIEFARSVCGLKNANSPEINPDAEHKVVDILEEQKKITDKGGTMRLGSYQASLKRDSLASVLYNNNSAKERHRHRYEINPKYYNILEQNGLNLSGINPDRMLAEFIELQNHPFFIATQGHPELKSRLEKPAPLFLGLVNACIKNQPLISSYKY